MKLSTKHFFFTDTAPTQIYTLSLHDALPISSSRSRTARRRRSGPPWTRSPLPVALSRSEEHTSELQSPDHLVCRLLLEKKKKLPVRQTCRGASKNTLSSSKRIADRASATLTR